MTPALRRRALPLIGFLVCTGLICFALYLQYVEHLEPCPLCMMQRLAFFALAILFLIMTLHGPRPKGLLIYGVLLLTACVTGLCLASRHVWLQWNPPPIDVCTADLFFQLQRFPWLAVVNKALRATGDCAKVDWRLFGLSIAEWSWLWFLLLTLFVLRILAQAYAALKGARFR